MALGFMKKMFSFGRTKDEEPAGPQKAPEPAPQPAPAEPRAATPPAAFPRDGDMAFTPETMPTTPAADDEREAPADTPASPAPAPETTESAGAARIEPEPERQALDAERSDAMISTEPPDNLAGETPLEVPEDTFADDALAEAVPPEPTLPPPAEPAVPELKPTPPAVEPSSRPGPGDRSGIRITTGGSASEALPAAPAEALSWLQRLRRGLSLSSNQLTEQISGIFTRRKLDDDTLQDLEDVLIQADLGVETAMRVTGALAAGRYGRNIASDEVTAIMAGEIEKVLGPVARPLELDLSVKPHVILVVGVNGTGKTTTIGKLAAKLVAGGLKVTLAAGDTFRAAAIEQLKIWGERTGSEVIASRLGADAAGLAYDAFEKARANGSDVLIVDTAGRLQNKAELMAELEKVVRVLAKLDPDAPHTVLQTLDATTGQNALNQVEIFRNVAGVNGLVMTKLDGSARGGILVAIAARHKLPVYFVGVGEGIDDLEPFEAKEFAAAIAGTPLR